MRYVRAIIDDTRRMSERGSSDDANQESDRKEESTVCWEHHDVF